MLLLPLSVVCALVATVLSFFEALPRVKTAFEVLCVLLLWVSAWATPSRLVFVPLSTVPALLYALQLVAARTLLAASLHVLVVVAFVLSETGRAFFRWLFTNFCPVANVRWQLFLAGAQKAYGVKVRFLETLISLKHSTNLRLPPDLKRLLYKNYLNDAPVLYVPIKGFWSATVDRVLFRDIVDIELTDPKAQIFERGVRNVHWVTEGLGDEVVQVSLLIESPHKQGEYIVLARMQRNWLSRSSMMFTMTSRPRQKAGYARFFRQGLYLRIDFRTQEAEKHAKWLLNLPAAPNLSKRRKKKNKKMNLINK